MKDYIITRDQNGDFVIHSDYIVAGSIAVNIPNKCKQKKRFISMFLHKADIEEGISFLKLIQPDNKDQINRALFMSALANMAKCFQHSDACIELDKKDFLAVHANERSEFERFLAWRNMHFIHDANSMREAIAFFPVAPMGHESVWGGEPSVLWNRVPIDYVNEGEKLLQLMSVIHSHITSKIDEIGSSILAIYEKRTRNELLSYGEATIKGATTLSPENIRNKKHRIP